MPVAPAVEECVRLAPLWKLARVENVYNVGHRRGRNGSVGLDGCYVEGPHACGQFGAGDMNCIHDMKI